MSLNKVKNVFLNADGRLRAGWQLTAAAVLWYAVYIGAAVGLSRLLLSLFAGWGVTNANIALAPNWVRFLAGYQVQLINAAAALICAAAAYPLARMYRVKKQGAISDVCISFGIGVAAAMVLMVMFLISDSLRVTSGVPVFNAGMAAAFVFCTVTAVMEGTFVFGYVRAMTSAHAGRIFGHLLSAAMFLLISLPGIQNFMGAVNALLVGMVLSLTAERAGNGACIALRTGWLWGVSALAGFPGSSGMYTMYSVSEEFFTGGTYGPEAGAAVGIICLAITVFAFREELKLLIAKLKKA